MAIALGIVKIVFAGFIGWFSFAVLFFFGKAFFEVLPVKRRRKF